MLISSGNIANSCSEHDSPVNTNPEQNQTILIKEKFTIKGTVAVCNGLECKQIISYKNHAINNLRTHLYH